MRARTTSRLAQVLRKVVQLSVLAFVLWSAFTTIWRNYKTAHNDARIVGLIHGELSEKAYAANERLLSLWGESLEAGKDFVGMPWSARVFGIELADPIMALSHVVRSREITLQLALGVGAVVLTAAVLGKVFCSHLCPMRLVFELGQLLRSGLSWLGVPLPSWRSGRRLGGWVLVGGLVGATFAGGAMWFFVLPYVGIGAGIFLLVTAGSVGAVIALPIVLFVADVLFAPGVFCHELCPQGFLLEQLGRWSPLRLVRASAAACPPECRACQQICPYGLSPRDDTHRPACDNCGSCVAMCPTSNLSRKFRLPVVVAMLLCLAPRTAHAHHNKGLPHYGYYENYPQVPTEERVVIQGRWEMGATIFNFQGYDRRTAETPNDVKFFVYLYDLKLDGGYVGPVRFDILLDDEVVSTFSRERVDEEQVYSTRETLPQTGEYELVAHFDVEGKARSVRLPFAVDLGEQAVNWWLVGGMGLPALALFLLALVGRSKAARAAAMRAKTAGGAALATLLAWTHRADAYEPVPQCINEGGGAPVAYPTENGQVVQTMAGMPGWMLVASVALVIAVSFIAFERFGTAEPSKWRFNLIRNRKVYAVVRHRWFQPAAQLLSVVALASVLVAGLVGSASYNIAPVFVWTLWWAALIFAVALLGPAFCFACPWDGVANIASRLRVAARAPTLSLGFAVPRFLKNLWPAIILFVLLTWAELGLGITSSPRGTAYLGVGMAALAVCGALLFEGKAFCRHACPVGRISGMYANFSPIELRARNPRTCKTCTTEDCLNGNDRGYACPTGISLKVVSDSTYCIGCTECIKSCDRHNVALNLRPPATGLAPATNVRSDEAWLCVMLLSLTLFHGLTMTTSWDNHAPGEASLMKWMGATWGTVSSFNFSVGMLVAVALPIGLYWLASVIAARLARVPGVTAGSLFRRYAFSLVPVALFYHMAHNAMHLGMEAGHVVPLLSDPLGRGSDYFGTAAMQVGHLVPETPLSVAQIGLIVVGHLFGIYVAHRISRRVFGDARAAMRSLLPMTAMMVLVSVAGLSLMVLDMNLRVGRM